MKTYLTSAFLCFSIIVMAQPSEAVLLGNWQDTSIVVNTWLNGRYLEVWGLNINNREIGVIASTEGVHFIDVTDPQNLHEIESAFVRGAVSADYISHRDYHDYNGYLYAVADEGPSTLQVIDISQLPDTAFLVYDNNEFIRTSHNIFIDTSTAHLYACGVRSDNGFASLAVLSLANPETPQLLNYVNDIEGIPIPYVHDMYVKNDTAYLNGAQDGLWVADFSDPVEPVLLGNMIDYPQKGYNHSGWLSEDGQYYFLADETHGKDLKTVSVADFNDMSVVATFDAGDPEDNVSIPHNLIVRCNYLYVSYYYDGLVVYDISDPENPERILYYDTYPGINDAFYRGAWGVFPFLESGNILVSDIQSGLYVFQNIDDYNCDATTAVSPNINNENIAVFPTVVTDLVNIQSELGGRKEVVLYNLDGQMMIQENFEGKTHKLNVYPHLVPGFYVLEIKGDRFRKVEKIVVQPK